MAANPPVSVVFTPPGEPSCPDCGRRQVSLPQPLPPVGDDFDWRLRDYDGIRRFMLEELAARFPERNRWTAADLEVVLVEALAAVLDQLSDMLDRVAAEAVLETARQPASVRRLLAFIGFDAARAEGLVDDPPATPNGLSAAAKLERLWTREPWRMDEARLAGPRAIHTQRRIVTPEDAAARLAEHPLVLRASAWPEWSGAWPRLRAAVVLAGDAMLDERFDARPAGPALLAETLAWSAANGWPPPVQGTATPTYRAALAPHVEALRMAGTELVLADAVFVGLFLSVSVRVAPEYFRSEVRDAVEAALGSGADGFFAPGRLAFGEDVYASDLYQALMALDGVEDVCLNALRRIGAHQPDQLAAGRVPLEGIEIAACDNDPARPERGRYALFLHGGRAG
jgi:hypothetical protein